MATKKSAKAAPAKAAPPIPDDGLVPIVYVGKKPFAADNVAHSKKTWNGPGDVQRVTLAQSKRLLMHPDQWAISGEEPKDAGEVAARIESIEVSRNGKTLDQAALEAMSAPELVAYAEHYLGLELDAATPVAELLETIKDKEFTDRVTSDFERNSALSSPSEKDALGTQQAS